MISNRRLSFFGAPLRPVIAAIGVGWLLLIVVPAASAAESDDYTGPHSDPSAPEWTAQDVVDDPRNDDPSRADLDDEQADELADLIGTALQAEEEERYDDAQQKFVRAYTIFPHSNLLLSVARVSDRSGDDATALQGYKRFSERQPDYGDRDKIEERIQDLERQIEPTEQTSDEDVKTDPGRSMPRPSVLGWTGTGVGVAGLLSIIAGARIASSVDSDFETLEQLRADSNQSEFDRLASDIETQQSRGQLFLYGGIGLTAAGLTMVAYDLLIRDRSDPVPTDEPPGTSIRMTPIGSTGAALVWHHSF